MSFLKQLCCIKVSPGLDYDNYNRFVISPQEVVQELDSSTDVSSNISYDNDISDSLYPHDYFKYIRVEKKATFLVNNQIELDEESYNCIHDGCCLLCRLLLSNESEHLDDKLHKRLLSLRNSRVLSEFKDCIISKLPSSNEYHCATCNDVWLTLEEVREHCQTEDHKIKLRKCMKVQETQIVENQLEPEVKDLYIIPFFNINTTINNLLYDKTSLSYKNNEIAINYDDYAEFALNMEVPPDFTGHLDFGDGKKVFLNAIKIEDSPDSEIELAQTNPMVYPSTSSEESINYMPTNLTFNSTKISANPTTNLIFNSTKISDNPKKLNNLNVQQSNNHVIINNKIMLKLKNWHCIIGTVSPNCYLCHEDLELQDFNQHIKNKKHVDLMKDRKFRTIAEHGLSIIMELQPKGTYHCGICNMAGLNEENIEVHINSDHHLNHYHASLTRLKRPNASKRNIVEKPLKIESLLYVKSKGVMVDKLILFASMNWQACIINGSKKNELHCQLCDVKMDRQVAPIHWNEKKHVTNMAAAIVLDKYQLNCIRKIRSSLFYCTPCGLSLCGDKTVDSHVNSGPHKNNYKECLISAKEVIDKNMKMVKL